MGRGSVRSGLPGAGASHAGVAGNTARARGDAAGKRLVPSFVHFARAGLPSNHVAYQCLWICGGCRVSARGDAARRLAGVARSVPRRSVRWSTRVNGAASLPNSEIKAARSRDCAMLAVTDIRMFRPLESSVCRVSDGLSGYRDDLVNYGGIADLPGDPEFGLSLLCPNVSRPVRPIVTSYESTPGEADPRRSNAQVRTPCGAPGQENYTSWCVSGFSQVFVPKV